MQNIKKLQNQLKKYASFERKKTNQLFFKTRKGEYGEGDVFIGVRTPDTRKVARLFLELSFKEIEQVLKSKIHEERLCALFILVEKNKIAFKSNDKKKQRQIVNFYLKNKTWVNNWDLVDTSAHFILGQAVMDKIVSKKVLDDLAGSKNLWDRRIGIISTWIMIRSGEYKTTIKLSEKLLADKEDLIHKAVGWMLREIWKKDSDLVEKFIKENYDNMPRTTLRYTIEKMDEIKRKIFLKGKFNF